MRSNGIGRRHGTPPVSHRTAGIHAGVVSQWHRFTEQVIVWKGIRLKCQEDVATHHRLMRARLVDACPITRTAKTLAEGLALARASSDAKSSLTAAQKLNDEVLRLQAALATAEAESMRHQKRRDTWPEQWSAAIGVLGLHGPPAYSSRRCRTT